MTSTTPKLKVPPKLRNRLACTWMFSYSKAFIILILLITIPLSLAACAEADESIEPGLGQEFSLPIGKEASIKGADLRIGFEDVIEDNRCPLDVNCVWEGQAEILVKLVYEGETYRIVLSEPGLTDFAVDTFHEYVIGYHLEPYPQDAADISEEDYSLRLTVNRQEDIEEQPSYSPALDG